MSIDIVPRFGRLNQVRPFPFGPVHQVVGAGERVELFWFEAGTKMNNISVFMILPILKSRD